MRHFFFSWFESWVIREGGGFSRTRERGLSVVGTGVRGRWSLCAPSTRFRGGTVRRRRRGRAWNPPPPMQRRGGSEQIKAFNFAGSPHRDTRGARTRTYARRIRCSRMYIIYNNIIYSIVNGAAGWLAVFRAGCERRATVVAWKGRFRMDGWVAVGWGVNFRSYVASAATTGRVTRGYLSNLCAGPLWYTYIRAKYIHAPLCANKPFAPSSVLVRRVSDTLDRKLFLARMKEHSHVLMYIHTQNRTTMVQEKMILQPFFPFPIPFNFPPDCMDFTFFTTRFSFLSPLSSCPVIFPFPQK